MEDKENDIPAYIELRNLMRGGWREQLEIMSEYGFQAWLDRDLTIRAKFPKPVEKKNEQIKWTHFSIFSYNSAVLL